MSRTPLTNGWKTHAICLIAIARASLCTTYGEQAQTGADPYGSGADLARLEWAEQNCGGQAKKDYVQQLRQAENIDREEFAAGRRAANRDVNLTYRGGGVTAACKEILELFGPEGSVAKNAFRKDGK